MSLQHEALQGFASRAIHWGYDPLAHNGAVTPPVYLTSTFAFPTIEDGARRFAGAEAGYVYSRVGNPTTRLLEQRVAALERTEDGVATASGMGAITATLWTLLAAGDEVVADGTLYGCTYAYLRDGLPRFGVKVTFADLSDPAQAEVAITSRTRMVFFETPSNPNLGIVDISRISEIAHRFGSLVVVDNTFATPFLQRPMEMGADLTIHSATKYLGGHGDLLGGIVVGSRDLIERVRMAGVKELTGAPMSAFDAFLVLRGLKTLELRMLRHCEGADVIAKILRSSSAVQRVYYPFIADHPQNDLARRQMLLGGGVVAAEFKDGKKGAMRFMDALRLFTRAVSLGDAESLVQHPASMTHRDYAHNRHGEAGFSDGLVRLAVGLESLPDLAADVNAALEAASARHPH